MKTNEDKCSRTHPAIAVNDPNEAIRMMTLCNHHKQSLRNAPENQAVVVVAAVMCACMWVWMCVLGEGEGGKLVYKVL